MAIGTPLYAARAGHVSWVSYGLLCLQTPGGERDWYVHIDRVAYAGNDVQAGELVAYSGAKVPNGGSLTGPHLHFEVQTGSLNVPATSHDPTAILETDMTPEESALLSDLHAAAARLELALGTAVAGTAGAAPSQPNYLGWSQSVTAALSALTAAISSRPPGALTAAQAGTLEVIASDVANIKLRVEKDLAP